MEAPIWEEKPVYTIPVPETKINQPTRARLGEAIYLLAYLIQRADWRTGRARVSCRRIADDTGFPEATVRRWLGVLRQAGEVVTARVPDGLMVTITDYASIARTRGVRTAGPPSTSDRSPAGARSTASDQSDPPPAALGSTVGERSIICSTKPSQNMEKRGSNTTDYLCDEELERTAAAALKRSRPHPKALFPTPDQRFVRLHEAAKAVAGLDKPRRHELARIAAARMAADPRPFVRVFVTRPEDDEARPRSPEGERQVLLRMAEILRQEDHAGERGACATTRDCDSGLRL